MAHVGRRCAGGRHDVHGPLLGQLHDVLAQVVSTPESGRFQHVVQLHLLADHRLRLDHGLDVVLPRDVQHVLVGLGGVFRIEDRRSPAVMFRSNSTKSLSRLRLRSL